MGKQSQSEFRLIKDYSKCVVTQFGQEVAFWVLVVKGQFGIKATVSWKI